MNALPLAASIACSLFFLACSDSDASATSEGPGSEAAMVETISGNLIVPDDFAGKATKLVFGWGDSAIIDADGKLLGLPHGFLPSMNGIHDPDIVAGETFAFTLNNVNVPAGRHYFQASVYVEGTSNKVPETGKDYLAGPSDPIEFAAPETVVPDMTLVLCQGM